MRGIFPLPFLLLAILSASGAARAQAPVGKAAKFSFEGVIDINVAMEAGSGDLQLFKSGGRAKLGMKLLVNPMPAPIELAVLLDPKQPDALFLVNDNLRTYSSIDVTPKSPLPDSASGGKYILKVLGKAKIQGYECTHLTLTRSKELVDAWISQDFPDVYAVLKKLQAANPQFGQAEAFRALEEAGYAGLPMRCIVVRDGQRVTTEVRKIERKTLPASLFAVPADYKRSELAASGLQPTPEQVEEMKKLIQGALQGK